MTADIVPESLAETGPIPTGPIPTDESPITEARRVGPLFQPTHPLALAPVSAPPHSGRRVVRVLRQGVALSTVNDQYLALASHREATT